jgi:hypothetical protein
MLVQGVTEARLSTLSVAQKLDLFLAASFLRHTESLALIFDTLKSQNIRNYVAGNKFKLKKNERHLDKQMLELIYKQECM